jgi:hypothetical protein
MPKLRPDHLTGVIADWYWNVLGWLKLLFGFRVCRRSWPGTPQTGGIPGVFGAWMELDGRKP